MVYDAQYYQNKIDVLTNRLMNEVLSEIEIKKIKLLIDVLSNSRDAEIKSAEVSAKYRIYYRWY